MSVGIPVYNGEQFIAQAIESVLAQTYPAIELIISDNASEDATEDICRGYSKTDHRIRYFRLDRNVGANLNYRKVADLAAGDYFKWLAADDYLAPEFINTCLQEFARPEPVIVTTYMPYVDSTRNPLPFIEEDGGYRSEDGDIHRWLTPPAGLVDSLPRRRFEALLIGAIHNISTECFYGLIDRRALASVRPHGLYVGANKVLIAELVFLGTVVHLPIDLMFRRFHATNMGSRSLSSYGRMLGSAYWGGPLGVRLRHTYGYVQAIRRAPVGWLDKAASLWQLLRKVMG